MGDVEVALCHVVGVEVGTAGEESCVAVAVAVVDAAFEVSSVHFELAVVQ